MYDRPVWWSLLFPTRRLISAIFCVSSIPGDRRNYNVADLVHLGSALARRNVAMHLLPELHFVRDKVSVHGAHDMLTITETITRPTELGAFGPITEHIFLAAIWLGSSFKGCFRLSRVARSCVARSIRRQVWACIACKRSMDQNIPEPCLLASIAALATNGPSAPI
jgi:hypothetical protein